MRNQATPHGGTGPARPGVALRAGVWALSAALGIAGVALTQLAQQTATPAPAGWVTMVALLAAFATVESFHIHLPTGRHAQAFSLSEIPLVLGLFTIAPAALVLARVGGALVALLRGRVPPVKLVFSLCQFLFEAAFAAAVFHLIVGDGQTLGPRGWIAALVAVGGAEVISASAVMLAIRLHDGALERGAYRAAVWSGAGQAFANTCFGLIVVIVATVDWRALGLVAVFVVVLFLANRAIVALRRRHDAMQRLNTFTGSIARTLAVDEVADAVLKQLREQLGSDVAQLTLAGSDDEPPRTWISPASHRALPADGIDTLLAAKGTRDETARALLDSARVKDAMVVPLTADDETIGVVAVADRMGDSQSYSAEDLEILIALANHASVALRNAALADRLREQVTFIEHQALHDALTGLPNRRLFTQELAEAPGPVAVLLLDLDGFKDVNDALGHSTGDALLQLVAERLVEHLTGARSVARLGGDEFVVAVDVSSHHQALGHARRILEALSTPFSLPDMALSVDASIGVAVSATAADGDELLKQADIAMYAAKAGRTGIQEYAPALDRSSPERLLLPSELREAIRTGGLTVHYQPKTDLSTGDVHCVEALVRWDHPRRGLISPGEFIPLAEQTGLIVPLTHRVIASALERCRLWQQEGHDIGVAVNLAPRLLHDDALPQALLAALDRAGLPASVLTLEVTESDIMADPNRNIAVLRRLADMGVTLSVDDLGTGYSSLSYLKRLPVHEIKIDRSFVMAMSTDSDDEAIVEAIVALGQRLSKRVVAEGVEDEETYARLRALGCDVAQGFWISRPMPGDDVVSWLQDWRTQRLQAAAQL